jgi:LysM repeat protein
LLTASEAEGAPSEQSCSNPVYVTVMYEVKKGDTWSKVARRYKISVARLKAMNSDVVFVRGAVLKAPILISCQDRPTPTPFPVQTWPRG